MSSLGVVYLADTGESGRSGTQGYKVSGHVHTVWKQCEEFRELGTPVGLVVDSSPGVTRHIHTGFK